MAQRVSEQLRRQDAATARGVVAILTALRERHAASLELIFASKAVAEFSAGLEEKPAPVPAFPSSEVTGA